MNSNIYDNNIVDNIMKAVNDISENDIDLENDTIENNSNNDDDSEKNLVFEDNESINSEKDNKEIYSKDDVENIELKKNDFGNILEDANICISLLLDRLLNKSNIDNYKYIIDNLRMKVKRVSISGEAEKINACKKITNKRK